MRTSDILVLVISSIAVGMLSSCSATRDVRDGYIVTEEQLRTAGPSPEEVEIERQVAPPGSPQIIVDAPEVGSDVTAPVRVSIRFVPEDGSEIVPDSLRVTYHGLIDIDATDTVRKKLAVSRQGIEGEIPPVRPQMYDFTLSIADTNRRTGSARLRYRVVRRH